MMVGEKQVDFVVRFLIEKGRLPALDFQPWAKLCSRNVQY